MKSPGIIIFIGLCVWLLALVLFASEEKVMAKCKGTIYVYCSPLPLHPNQVCIAWAQVDLDKKCKNPDLHCEMFVYYNLVTAHYSGLQPGILQISPELTAPVAGYVGNEFEWLCQNCGGGGEFAKNFQVE